jgi:formylmethanofuran:tetrahydromethanopterin formyltransferase
MIKPDATLEETVAEAIAQRLTTGKIVVLKRHALAKHAAQDAFRQGIAAAGQVVAEMAAITSEAAIRPWLPPSAKPSGRSRSCRTIRAVREARVDLGLLPFQPKTCRARPECSLG